GVSWRTGIELRRFSGRWLQLSVYSVVERPRRDAPEEAQGRAAGPQTQPPKALKRQENRDIRMPAVRGRSASGAARPPRLSDRSLPAAPVRLRPIGPIRPISAHRPIAPL